MSEYRKVRWYQVWYYYFLIYFWGGLFKNYRIKGWVILIFMLASFDDFLNGSAYLVQDVHWLIDKIGGLF